MLIRALQATRNAKSVACESMKQVCRMSWSDVLVTGNAVGRLPHLQSFATLSYLYAIMYPLVFMCHLVCSLNSGCIYKYLRKWHLRPACSSNDCAAMCLQQMVQNEVSVAKAAYNMLHAYNILEKSIQRCF